MVVVAVPHAAQRERRLRVGQRDRGAAVLHGERVRDLQHREQVARVTLAAVDEVTARVLLDRHRLGTEAALGIAQRAVEQLLELRVAERLQPEQRAARQQWSGEREERVLGRRADEDEQAFLDEREQHVLLCAAEAVHLVEEEDRAAALLTQPGAGALGDLAHVLHPRAHRREDLERLGGRAGDQLGDRRLADTGRPPEDERRESVRLDEDAQRLAPSEQVPLADDLVERAGAEPGGERRPASEPLLDGGREEVGALRRHPASLRRARPLHQIGEPCTSQVHDPHIKSVRHAPPRCTIHTSDR
ncbi:MAG: hypothetical protein KatS3mg010_0625 [Acidimicrobiia bacterium]|nr:MAG: hypothetical protein KatS3mg010_0625 [Acidimicrobiia bacterium]